MPWTGKAGAALLLGLGAQGHSSAQNVSHDVDRLQEEFPDISHATLMRFLVSCKMDATLAAEKLRRHLRWREQTFPLHRERLLDVLKKGILVQHGSDGEGRPILIYFGNHYNSRECDVDRVVQAMVWVLERALGDALDQKVVLMIYTPSGAAVDLKLIRALSVCFSEHYPERLHKAIIWPAGRWAQRIWLLIRWCFVPGVRNKVVLLRHDEPAHTALGIDPSRLPMIFGGGEDWEWDPSDI